NEQIDAVSQTLPVGVTLSRLTVQGEQVAAAVYGVSLNILETLVIVLAIVILFLGWRTGLIVGAIVPSVVLATLAVMGLFELPLERMSLATLVISLGLLVDNGIVIAEDFKRRLEDTGDRDAALRETSSELAFPLLSSSLTTIVVFLPLLIMDTEASEYTRSITYVVLISLGVSWFFAMTVTTTLCHRLLPDPATNRGESREHPGLVRRTFRRLDRVYELVLRTILRRRWAYLGLMGILFCFGGWLMGLVPKKFFPDSDRAQILVYADLPVGVTSRATDQAVQKMMQLVGDKEQFPDFIDYAAYVGFGGPRFVLSLNPVDPSPHSAFLMINAKDRSSAEAALPRLRDAFRAALPEVNARVSRMFLGPADPNVIQLQVKGPDANYLMQKTAGLEEMLLSLDGTIDVWSDWHGRTKRLKLEVDRHLAAAAGVTATDVANALTGRVSGQEVTELASGDDLIPIVLRGRQAERNSLDRLGALTVFPANGGPGVPLSQVANWSYETGLGVIAREDLIRTVTVEARNLQLTPEDMQPLLQGPLEEFSASLAPGHFAEFDGILEDTVESNAALAATGPLVLFLIVLLLILQFGGYRRPAVILLSLPFVVIGASIGLVLMQAEFGFMVILGLYALMGIIINNSIVLIDRSDIERRLANDPSQDMLAVIRACQRRLRPVLMTTITTAAGLLPLILSQDVLFYGMASAMAFGLLIGTLLVSLGLTPVLYTLFLGIKPTSSVLPSEGASLTLPEPKAPSPVSVRLSPPAHVVANGKSSRRPRKKAKAH
ncbi:MAG: efflux RND transporter permease subunit, partial [Verrucomicrobiota bacterium]